MLDLLPTSPTLTSVGLWVLILGLACALTFGLVVLSAEAEDRHDGLLSAAPPLAVAGIGIVNLRLVVRARDVFWNDTWVSVLLIVVLVCAIAAFVSVWALANLDDLSFTLIGVLAGAALPVIGALGWMIDHAIDTLDRSLTFGLSGTLLLLLGGMAFMYVLAKDQR